MAIEWATPLIAVTCLWVVNVIACIPLLGVARIRSLFEGWPTERMSLNYLVLSSVVVFGHAGIFFAGIVITGGLSGRALVQWTMVVAGGYPLGLWLLFGGAATATGHWTPVREAVGRWITVGIVALTYAIVTVVAAALVFFILFLLYFPG